MGKYHERGNGPATWSKRYPRFSLRCQRYSEPGYAAALRIWSLPPGNEIVELTPKAFDTLLLLVRNSGHLLEKDELISMIWPETFVEEGSLSNNIFLLRKALGENPAFIETVPRRGYRFVGAVRQFPPAAPTHTEKPPEMGARGFASLPVKALRPWRSWAGLGIAAVALLALLASAGWLYRRDGRSGEAIDSLAVLPFVNANADPNTEYLSDGITESLINSLSQLPNLKVMSRDSAFRYKGRDTATAATSGDSNTIASSRIWLLFGKSSPGKWRARCECI